MQLATGIATIEDFETGEYYEKYRIVFTSTGRNCGLEAIKWFAKSKYDKVIVVPDPKYRDSHTMRQGLAERMGYFAQPEDCFVSIVQKNKRLYLEKTCREEKKNG